MEEIFVRIYSNYTTLIIGMIPLFGEWNEQFIDELCIITDLVWLWKLRLSVTRSACIRRLSRTNSAGVSW